MGIFINGQSYYVIMSLETTLAQKRILVVDDDLMTGRVAERVLARKYAVEIVSDAEEALTKYSAARDEVPYDVVLTDTQMPGRSGPELIDSIREIDPDARCVLMSGSPENEEYAKEVGVPFLAKPFRPNELYSTIDALFE